MKAKLNLYLTHEGCERLVKSGPDSYWHWHVLPRIVAILKDDEWAEPVNNVSTVPEGCKLIGVAEVELPSHHEATDAAVEGIRAQLIRERAEFTKRETEAARRMNELLAISFEPRSVK